MFLRPALFIIVLIVTKNKYTQDDVIGNTALLMYLLPALFIIVLIVTKNK